MFFEPMVSDQEFVRKSLNLLHNAPGAITQKKLAVVVGGGRRCTIVCSGTHAAVTNFVLESFEQRKLGRPEICLVVGICNQSGCRCGGLWHVRQTALLPDNTRITGESRPFPPSQLAGMVGAMPGLMQLLRQVFPTQQPKEADGDRDA